MIKEINISAHFTTKDSNYIHLKNSIISLQVESRNMEIKYYNTEAINITRALGSDDSLNPNTVTGYNLELVQFLCLGKICDMITER